MAGLVSGAGTLGAHIVCALVRLLLALLGRAAVAEAELSSPEMAVIRDAARAVAVPAWAERTPREVFGGTFGARYVWAPLRAVGADLPGPAVEAEEIAPPAVAFGPARGWRDYGRSPVVGARVRVRRRGPPPRASPAGGGRRRGLGGRRPVGGLHPPYAISRRSFCAMASAKPA